VAATFVADRGVVLHVDGAPVWSSASTGQPRAIGADWFLGARAAATESFAGAIDDVQVYRGALEDGEVAWLHAHPGEPLCTPGWQSYGSGLAGAVGVPTLDVEGRLRVGKTFDLVVSNSSGKFIGQTAVVLGFTEAATPLLGGTLLVELQGAIVFARLIGPTVTPIPKIGRAHV